VFYSPLMSALIVPKSGPNAGGADSSGLIVVSPEFPQSIKDVPIPRPKFECT